jgi:DNA-binding beta-propeller fold protein YncE
MAEINPLAQFGTPGTDAAGGIAGPYHGAVDPATGDLYVADDSNERVSVFNRDGAFLRGWGTDVDPTNAHIGPEVCTTTCQFGQGGAAAGELDGPDGIVISAAGEVFVSEYANDRISVFTREGRFLRAFGLGVTGMPTSYGICTITCSAGTNGAFSAGAMDNPHGIEIGPDGLLYVADSDNNRVNSYALTGEFVRSLGQGVATFGPDLEACTTFCTFGLVAGNAEGSFVDPEDVGFDSAGRLWVSEHMSDRVSAIVPGAAPSFVRMVGFDVIAGNGETGFEVCTVGCKTGVPGPAAGQLANPSGVAATGDDTLYVADLSNHRISAYSASTGAFQKAFGGDVIPGSPFEFEVCTTTCQIGDQDDFVGAFDGPTGLTIDCRGAIYVVEGFGARVQRFGEPGLRKPPCPSNAFEITKIGRNKRKGRAIVTVEVPGPGELALAGKKLRTTHNRANSDGAYKLSVLPRGKAKRKLAKRGKLKVSFAITFTPDEGDPATQARKLKLKRKRRP